MTHYDAPRMRRRDRILTNASLGLMRLRRSRSEANDTPPLFIIGSGRSGNTLVRRILLASGEIFIPPETFVLGEIIEGWARTALLTWRERVWLFCAYFEKHLFFPTFRLDNLNEFAAQAIALPPKDRKLKTLIESYYRFLAEAEGSSAARWGDKTPYNVYFLTTINTVFPDAQYLWLIRDGRDVALSYVQAELYGSFAEAAQRWVESNRACATLAARCPNVYRQSYEDLVTQPEECFRTICDWAGLPFSPEMLTTRRGPMGDVEALDHHHNVTQPISATSIGRWRDGVSPTDIAALPSEFWSTMEKLGYACD